MSVRIQLAFVLFVGAVMFAGSSAHADVITSSPFSVGYGFLSNWNKSETDTANTPPGTNSSFSLGAFDFTISVTSGFNSSGGPGFPGRVLTTGGINTGLGTNFEVSIQATHNGTPPPYVAGTPNYQIQLNIDDPDGAGAQDGISVYAVKHSGQDGGTTNTIQWFETTVGHTDSSVVQTTLVDNGVINSHTLASSFTQIVWDPTEFTTAGLTQTRVFQITRTHEFMLDGFEISGSASLTYDAVPEPASLGLLALGAVFAGRRRRRA